MICFRQRLVTLLLYVSSREIKGFQHANERLSGHGISGSAAGRSGRPDALLLAAGSRLKRRKAERKDRMIKRARKMAQYGQDTSAMAQNRKDTRAMAQYSQDTRAMAQYSQDTRAMAQYSQDTQPRQPLRHRFPRPSGAATGGRNPIHRPPATRRYLRSTAGAAAGAGQARQGFGNFGFARPGLTLKQQRRRSRMAR